VRCMDCGEALQLILKQQDEVLSAEETTLLDAHAACCPSCSRELALYGRLSGTLHAFGQEETQAPPELCGLVMSSLRAEKQRFLRRLSPSWRQAVAAAAALALLAGGSAGVNVALKVAGTGGKTAYVQPSHKDNSLNKNTNIGGNHNTTPSPDISNPGASSGPTPQTGDSGGSSTPTNNNLGNTGSSTSGRRPTVAALPTPEPQVLLNGGLKISSTLLKVSVADLSDAKARAQALAGGAKAGIQAFPEQVSDKRIQVTRLTVSPDSEPGLLSALSGLGNVIDKQTESRDLTTMYNQTLAQYRDLQTRIEAEDDPDERQQLENQAAGLREQLNSWKSEADKRVIVLWLES